MYGQAFLTSFDKVHLHFPNLRKLLTFLEKKKVLPWLKTQNISIAYSSFVIIRLNKSFTSATVGHSLELNYLTLTTTPDAPILVKRQFIYTAPHQNHKVNQLWIINLT